MTDGLESPEGSTYTLQTANGVFVSNAADVPNIFESELDSVFNGNLHSVDFAGDSVEATNLINQWVRIVIFDISFSDIFNSPGTIVPSGDNRCLNGR